MRIVKNAKAKSKIAIPAEFGLGKEDINKIAICDIFGHFKIQMKDNQLVSIKWGGAVWLRFGVFCATFGGVWSGVLGW